MKQQIALPGLEALSERQELALAIIRQHGPIRSGELGARVREERGGRPSGAEYDASNGRALGEWLKRNGGLVEYVRGEGWVDVERAAARPKPEPVPEVERVSAYDDGVIPY